ncbi:Mif2/CENP-C like-domain-containing protein [Hypomontagnella monticulosa]|nr:Mif2/CENP-C like-domain-containing protein [Hypomontagnella monticulosa]
MPPKQSSQRRMTQSQNEQVYELGVHGRKTGITLAQRARDEHGFETVDNLFSSPEKDVPNVPIAAANGVNGRNHAESDEEQTMEIDDESQMGPATTMKQRQNRPSLPRARSPIKTHLQSPARQNPHLGPTSSPSRGSIVTAREPNPPKSVNRRLDFSKSSQHKISPPVNGRPKVNGSKARNGKLPNGRAHADESDEEEEVILRGKQRQPQRRVVEQEEEEEEDEDEDQGESMQILDAGDDEANYMEDEQDSPVEPEPEPQPEPEEEPEEQTQQSKSAHQPKKRGRKPKAQIAQEEEGESSIQQAAPEEPEEIEEAPVKKKQRGRPPKASPSTKEPEPPKSKRRRSERNSGSSTVEEQEPEQEPEDNVDERNTKRQRTENNAAATRPGTTKEKGKPGRKRKSSGIGVDEPIVQRGPPLPKGRGLVALRREEDDAMIRTTRSGRHSYRPLDFWRGEQVIYDDAKQDVFEDKGRHGHFMMPSVKGVVRVAEPYSAPKRRRGRPSKRDAKSRRRSSTIIEEEVVERDDWEFDPGRITGDCIFWRPEHEGQPPDDEDLEVEEEELAISEAAVQLKDIKDATFRFAKTLTLPFFGSGIVDMPPGSEKRTKNSRKMQMVFFVHTGSVEVTVAQTEFRIGKGGMWFVPRGNHYSIANNTDNPARIFFAQGCEVLVQEDMGEDGTQ